jgi:hypothetical protein
MVSPTIMGQSKKLFYKTLIFMPIYEKVQISKSKPKNSHSCVPLNLLYCLPHIYPLMFCAWTELCRAVGTRVGPSVDELWQRIY